MGCGARSGGSLGRSGGEALASFTVPPQLVDEIKGIARCYFIMVGVCNVQVRIQLSIIVSDVYVVHKNTV
jgi:hypothetical protein